MLSQRRADHLIWVDLEFTNLDTSQGAIMQAAMIVTTAELQPLPPAGTDSTVGGLCFDIRLTKDQADRASEWVRQNQKQQLERSLSESALPVEDVAGLFRAYLLEHCEVPDDVRDRPLLAGNSVHNDERYLARDMPGLVELMSFRMLDVSSLKELAKRWAPALEFQKTETTIKQWYPGPIELKGEAHDALYDIKGSIAELAFYRKSLFKDLSAPPPGAGQGAGA